MITQLHTPIPLKTPKGKAWAIALIDYGPQWDLQWVTFIHATGECWTFRNSQIRQEQNYTWGLPQPSAIQPQTQAEPQAQTMRPTAQVHEMFSPHADKKPLAFPGPSLADLVATADGKRQ